MISKNEGFQPIVFSLIEKKIQFDCTFIMSFLIFQVLSDWVLTQVFSMVVPMRLSLFSIVIAFRGGPDSTTEKRILY